MPQLDFYSFFSVTTTLILVFVSLLFILHTYLLPKIAACLKFRKKIQNKQQHGATTVIEQKTQIGESFLDMENVYINEMEKTIKNITK